MGFDFAAVMGTVMHNERHGGGGGGITGVARTPQKNMKNYSTVIFSN